MMKPATEKPLPFISAWDPGIGGALKAQAECFVVEEIPLYEPEGEGEHVYVRLAREGWTTRDIHKSLARLFGLRAVDVGYAGLKDKHAHVTQTFSMALRDTDEETVARRVRETLPFEVIWARRHKNKQPSNNRYTKTNNNTRNKQSCTINKLV